MSVGSAGEAVTGGRRLPRQIRSWLLAAHARLALVERIGGRPGVHLPLRVGGRVRLLSLWRLVLRLERQGLRRLLLLLGVLLRRSVLWLDVLLRRLSKLRGVLLRLGELLRILLRLRELRLVGRRLRGGAGRGYGGTAELREERLVCVRLARLHRNRLHRNRQT